MDTSRRTWKSTVRKSERRTDFVGTALVRFQKCASFYK